ALGTLTGTSVCLGALTVHGHAAAVAQTLVASNFNFAANVCCNLAAQVTFYLEVAFDEVTKCNELIIGEVFHTSVTVDIGCFERAECASTTNTVDVGECNFHTLFTWNVDSCETCHEASPLELCGGVGHVVNPGLRPGVSSPMSR